MLEKLELYVKETAEFFKENSSNPFKIITPRTTEGIIIAAILTKTFAKENLKFSLSFVKEITEDTIKSIELEPYNTLLFAGTGGKEKKLIERHLKQKTIIILDNLTQDKINNVVVAYNFSKAINPKNKSLAYLPLILLDDLGGLKEIIEDEAKEAVEIKEGLTLFSSQTRYLHKVLEYSYDPYLPGVTGNEQEAINFIHEAGIQLKTSEGLYKKLVDLGTEDLKKLVTGILIHRLGSEETSENILGKVYLLKKEDDESPIKDLKEFKELVKACSYLKKPSLGVGACVGNTKLKKQAINLLHQHTKEIIHGLNWFAAQRKTPNVHEHKGYIIINTEEQINSEYVPILSELISNSNLYAKDTIIVMMGNSIVDTRISMRLVGENEGINLHQIAEKISKKMGDMPITGGYSNPNMAIPLEKTQEFIKIAHEILAQQALEEQITVKKAL